MNLLGAGWPMSEIDDLDLPFWIELLHRRQERKAQKETPKTVYVDEVRW